MTSFETTHRDLAMVKDYAMVPISWQDVTAGDTVLGQRDGMHWHVRRVEKHFATAIVSLVQGPREHVAEVGLTDPVHVLEDSTGFRRALYTDGVTVRDRKRKGDVT